jgi:hypothetical protein
MSEKLTRKEIQMMIYEDLGVNPRFVSPTYRDKIEKEFTLDEVKSMQEDEFHYYFDVDPDVVIDSKVGFVTKDITYESYLKSVTPKSSFKEFDKKAKDIEDASN